MHLEREKNIDMYNEDVDATGKYLYTGDRVYSATVATRIHSDAINAMFRAHFPEGITVLDVGCGDGIFTYDLAREINPRSIVGFDPAAKAIEAANQNTPEDLKSRVSFDVVDIYDIAKRYKRGQFDVALLRGMLHHLYRPEEAVAELGKVADNVIMLEPNGFNPILKVIEKVSPYHRRHEEKSYWPPKMNSWFRKNGYKVVDQRYACIVPFFCPAPMAKILKATQPFFEGIPLIRALYCGINVTLYQKTTA